MKTRNNDPPVLPKVPFVPKMATRAAVRDVLDHAAARAARAAVPHNFASTHKRLLDRSSDPTSDREP